MMTDWSADVETRNYRILHSTDVRNLRDLLACVLCFLLIASSLFGYLWIQSRIVSLGYSLQQSKEMEESLVRVQNSLILEEETLKCPERIDFIARNDLAMEPLGPYQRVVPRFREIGADLPASLVLADIRRTDTQLRRPAAHNSNN
jgi:cell division protein FtsL